VTVSVPPERSEEARAAMIELFPEGFEEHEGHAGVELTAYTERPDAVVRLEPLGDVRESPVVQGWEDAWKDFHKPVTIGRLWIGPPWEAASAGLIPIVIDPGRAFGTGAHATTRLCIELLLEVEPAGLVDLGCGSGVVAVAAAKLGFSPVVALDNDELAVAAARENAVANGVHVDARLADVLADPLPEVEVAVANIARAPVERALERFEGRIAIASGYLEAERPVPEGWRVVDRRVAAGWAADLLVREAPPGAAGRVG
jgi:ribosomal protein L11 methyltransferase